MACQTILTGDELNKYGKEMNNERIDKVLEAATPLLSDTEDKTGFD